MMHYGEVTHTLLLALNNNETWIKNHTWQRLADFTHASPNMCAVKPKPTIKQQICVKNNNFC